MNPEKFPEPGAEDEKEKTESIREEVDGTVGELEDAKEKIRLESIREKLRDFQKKEETGEIKSNHLIETPGYSKVDLDSLSREDLEMYGQIDNFTFEEFNEYRRNIPGGDKNRHQFAAFLANRVSPRLSQELPKKEKDK